jgi:hypothetical protein
MSQDLFAAFSNKPSKLSTNDNAPNVDDDDDFGDFEDASVAIETIPESQSTTHDRESSSKHPAKSPTVQRYDASPFPPKAPPMSGPSKVDSSRTEIGSHPFAGRMDLLFDAGDDEYDAGTDELGDLSTNPEAAMAYSKRIIAEQEAAQVKKEPIKAAPPKAAPTRMGKKMASSHSRNASKSDSGPKKLRKKSGYVPAQEPEVLFDAENLSDHESGFDELGDLEAEANGGSTTGVTPIALVGRKEIMPSLDLLGLDDPPAPTIGMNGDQRSDRAGITMPQPSPNRTQNAQAPELDDDAWDDFETAAPTTPPSTLPPPSHARTSSYTQPADNSTSALPPANIPPPSVLLSLFPPLFASADEALFNTMTKLDLKQRQILLSHPASHQFLKGYVAHCAVLARIIAGRKLRWKRDQRLSQSMRIGPSAAGGRGGMKLAGVDKAELAKEDREVLDTLDLWKTQVGKLRTAVTVASSAPGLPKLPAVPDIAENMPVRTLKPSEGGISASQACALCGLRREERVAKVDFEVEDSFGEWWVQGMNMHVACRRFWEEFERKLKSR